MLIAHLFPDLLNLYGTAATCASSNSACAGGIPWRSRRQPRSVHRPFRRRPRHAGRALICEQRLAIGEP
ncbi:MAG: hypothetical protein ACLT98_04400 [Eggerthellaceae bacterium]